MRAFETVQYLRVRADDGAIGVGRRVSVWQDNKWRLARVVEPWAAGFGSMLWLDVAKNQREEQSDARA